MGLYGAWISEYVEQIQAWVQWQERAPLHRSGGRVGTFFMYLNDAVEGAMAATAL